MGREVRRVPPGWEHPKNARGHYIPLLEGPFSKRLAEWKEEKAQWAKGLRRDYFAGEGAWKPIEAEHRDSSFTEWAGARPKAEHYMPEWPADVATHLSMYETCSEGTPISPAFATPEELARYLADHGASAFGSTTASYEAWLATARRGFGPSMFITASGVQSGVEALKGDA